MRPTRVLVVDDHPATRTGIRRLIQSEPSISVTGEATSAEEAISLVDAQDVDLVLMDIQLPGIDGIEAIQQMKVKHPDLKFIILSSFGDDYLPRAIEAGASGYLLKTATKAELVDAVVQVAEGKAVIDPNLTTGLFGQFARVSRAAQQHSLSVRQLEILRRVANGVPSKEIASQSAISDATLKRDLKRIFDQLGVNDRAQAVAEAYKRHLL